MDKEKLQRIRSQFPILKTKINGNDLVYLDNAATAQVPTCVLAAVNKFNQTKRANVHRSVDTLGNLATQEFENARKKVQIFLHAKSSQEVIFTYGATDSLNLASQMLEQLVFEGDEIVVSAMEHHSNLLVWQRLAKLKKAKLKFIELTPEQTLDLVDAQKKITPKTKIVAIAHASNVLGVVNPVSQIAELAHKNGSLIVVDGAQAAGHIEVDVQDLDADFYAFSGHKMYAPDGIGVLYGKKDLLKKLNPVRLGGEMISEVSRTGYVLAPMPQRFEAGTPNISGAISLAAAIDFINKIGLKEIHEHEANLVAYLLPKLLAVDEVELYGPKDPQEHTGVISFNLKGVHPHDLATALDLAGIEIRAGHHCAQPLMQTLNTESVARVSLGVFNQIADCDHLLAALNETKEFFLS